MADVAAATSIQGTVTLSGSPVSGATVTVLRWSGAQWVNTGVRSTTSSTGRYFAGGLSNWYTYTVEAYRAYSYCYPLGYFNVYRGYAQPLYAQGGARGANIAISFEQSISCHPERPRSRTAGGAGRPAPFRRAGCRGPADARAPSGRAGAARQRPVAAAPRATSGLRASAVACARASSSRPAGPRERQAITPSGRTSVAPPADRP